MNLLIFAACLMVTPLSSALRIDGSFNIQNFKAAGYTLPTPGPSQILFLKQYYETALTRDAVYLTARAEKDRKDTLANRPNIERRGQGAVDLGVRQDWDFINSTSGVQQVGIFSYTWPVWDRYLSTRIKQGEAQIIASDAQLEASKQDLIARILVSYLEVSSAKSKTELLQQQVNFLNSIREASVARHEVGAASNAELTEIQTDYQIKLSHLNAAQNELRYQMDDISRKTDLNFNEVLDLSKSTFVPSPNPLDIKFWGNLSAKQNPLVVFKTLESEASQHDIKAAKALFSPKVLIRASAIYQRPTSSLANSSRQQTASIGIFLNIPLTMGLGQSHEREAVFNYEKIRLELQSLKDQKATEAMRLYTDLVNIIDLTRSQLYIVNQQQVLVSQLSRGYRQGSVGYVDLLRANKTLTEQNTILQEQKYRGFMAWINLKLVTGLLNESDIDYIDNLYLGLSSSVTD